MLSKEALKIKKNKKGYRNDEYYGEKERDLKKIIKYEIMEYGNVDVLETLKNNHEEFSFVDDALLASINHQDYSEKEYDVLIEKIIKFIKEQLNTTDDLKGVWVCDSKKNVLSNYSHGNDEEINTVIFDGDLFIVSDLEDEGVLIACKDFDLK